MPIKEFIAIIYTTVMTISALHMPEPLLPLLAGSLKVEMDTIPLIMSATYIPLTIIPLISGIMLKFLSPKNMILLAALIHSLVVFFISIAENLYLVICLRFIEGFLISAILTSNTTYIALKSVQGRIQFFISYYIAFTIIGGLFGRIFSSIIANYFGWRICFQIMSVSLLIVIPVVYYFLENIKLPKNIDTKSHCDQDSFKELKMVFLDKTYLYIYIAIFCLFFVFSAITNFLPFRIKNIDKESSQIVIGFIYTGYITGIFMSFIATSIIKWIGNERKTMLAGFIMYGFFLLLLSIPSIPIIFVTMFGFCSGMFLVHSVASGYLNKIATIPKSLVNGAYIAFYYSGGVLGSYIPGLIYKNFGWGTFIGLLFVFIITGLCIITKLSDHA